ncbi:Rfx1p CYBJADRAFT_163461 [Cyberlindnera jadinii NRRL Y-1542]|uniref:RFX-type winged-helix domain-containing protein n=1 Tax=Cyberlindnera jadinii (strain ATCC 18201 / CBS 1600 / BCRC 20928 / JCM 3617 / NBRC 0987 / NRRL Y-1542) TaxID=983966 RepID=A0A1E4RYB9_CYBJN|nr:hypothetical protein CYBJADRAFT_163461 [Cyberlindnera jadinii NRRL Y-1542]ODV72267.1 hypothetical protein CYBJADRAFT_163461 [Cyberlindnera jadinii NRRL Y-1542]
MSDNSNVNGESRGSQAAGGEAAQLKAGQAPPIQQQVAQQQVQQHHHQQQIHSQGMNNGRSGGAMVGAVSMGTPNFVPMMGTHYPPTNGLQHFPYQQQAMQMQIPLQHEMSGVPVNFQPPPSRPMSNLHTPSKMTGDSTQGKHSSSSTSESARKRMRKSDHAFPGEDGDLELKNLAEKALEFPLDQVAEQVKAVEAQADSTVSTPLPNGKTLHVKSEVTRERQRQVFGMTWLMRACNASKDAVVPRNRIYARYVGICAENSLKPLSPASFGKLVRIVFPKLTTRRLGMRGQSKYHYCGLSLIGDEGNSALTSTANTPLHNHSGLDSSTFLPGTPYGSNSPASLHSQVSTPLLSNITNSTSATSITNFLNEHISPSLKFTPDLLALMNEKTTTSLDGPIELPDIKPYLPPETDLDVADTLYGLYKSHCTSVFESMRYVQLKRLYSLLSKFDGSLTAPVLKLYYVPSMMDWILACDTIMYKAVVKMLAKLALQEIPGPVLQQLKQISQNYTEKLHLSMKKMPPQLVKARLVLSKQFAQLMSRLVRVSETGQSANNVLSHSIDRKLMLDDWVKSVNVEAIVFKELPCNGENLKKAVETLQVKVPELLKKDKNDQDSFIFDWGLFVAGLPENFEDVPPRLFMLCASALLTSALREISLAGGPGFGGWWVVRCWIDEWIGWCAELGGFLSTPVDAPPLLTGSSDLPVSHTSLVADGDAVGAQEPQAVDLLDGQFGDLLTDSNKHGEDGDSSKS